MKAILKTSFTLAILLALMAVGIAAQPAGASNNLQSVSGLIISKSTANLKSTNSGSTLLSSIFPPSDPGRTGTAIVPYDPAVDQNGNPIVDPVVYNGFCSSGPNAVTGPNGEPVTYSRWVRADGTTRMKCQGNGTRVTVKLTGLLPHGVHSVWVLVFGPGPALPDGSNLLGVGALGRPDGSQNHFVASDRGEGELDVVMPAGVLSEIPYYVGPCLLTDERIGEVDIGVAYHMDGQTHGGSPGDDCSFAIPIAFGFITH